MTFSLPIFASVRPPRLFLFTISFTILFSFTASVAKAETHDTESVPTITVESSTIADYTSRGAEVSTINHIDAQQVEEINPRQINELLRTIPGITSDVRPGEVVEIHMRGVGQQEFMWEDTGVAIIIDGVPIWQNGGKFRLNMSEIKSIKVIKGAASYLYGNTALGGAVIITTTRPMAEDSYRVSVESGSHGYRDINVRMQKGTQQYAFNLGANYRDTDGYWIDSALRSKSITGKLSYYLNDSSDLTAGVDITNKYEQKQRGSTKGVTEANHNPRGTGRDSFQKENNVDLNKFYLTYAKAFDTDSNLMLNLYDYTDEYDYISSPQDTDGDGRNDTYTNHSHENIDQSGFKLEYRGEQRRFGYLLGYEHAERDHEDTDRRLADYATTTRGVTSHYYAGERSISEDLQIKNAFYGELKYAPTPGLTTIFNLRYDNQLDDYRIAAEDYDGTTWRSTFTSREKRFRESAYRLGVNYKVSERTSWYANVSTGFRTPTVDQLFAGEIKGDHYLNNESIAVQKSINYELGIKGLQKDLDIPLQYEIALFRTDNKAIIGRRDGTYYSGDNMIFDNVGDARNQGLELWLKSQVSQKLSLNLAYTYLHSAYTKHNPMKISFATLPDVTYDIEGNQLPRTPHHTLDLYATYRFTPHWKLIAETYARSAYYADETNRIKMGGYGFVNLQTRYEIALKQTTLEFYCKVSNVLDRQYYRTVFMTNDSNKDDVFDAEDATITVDPGREYYVGMIYRF